MRQYTEQVYLKMCTYVASSLLTLNVLYMCVP